MIDVKVNFFTDNNGGKVLASRIAQLGFEPVFIKDSHMLSEIESSDDFFNILIVDLAEFQKEKIIRILNKYPLPGVLKLLIFDDCAGTEEFYSSGDFLNMELFSRPIDIRAFLLLFEKIILAEKYKRLMKLISREAEIRIPRLEELLISGSEGNYEDDERGFFIRIIEFEKRILEEHRNLNDTIRRIALLRNNEYMELKDRIRAEELLSELRTQELMDARSVINAQESLLDYSTKELRDAKMTLTARENVEELGRFEAIQLHEELDRLKELNKNLEKRIELLQQDHETLKKKR
ncbi:MAG TPA: hypothetical protein PK514_09040 [Spirochaetota bacterium]|nr:hypothetical protein [Spirochaetota bacterium]